jgi:hypothetical protein
MLRVFHSLTVILACKLRMFLKKHSAALEIQKSYRCYFASKSYSELRSSAITLQTGLRTFGAYNEYIVRKRKKASIHIQVDFSFSLIFFYSSGRPTCSDLFFYG